MPSELQRVARGLVDCLDEVPQVILHLQRTADRCRENAALAMAASHGRATVAAQQLDAAARACEAAAHYLSMAPPKAKAWAERLVGDGRTTNRPDTASADRNKATGQRADVAERDSTGRTKRLTAPIELADDEDRETPEPPLVKVARTAFEKFRKEHEKDEDRQEEQPLEIEIVVAENGEKIAVLERDENAEKDRREPLATQIDVDLEAAVRQLLNTMTEDRIQPWERAALVITPTEVTATFDYPDERFEPPASPIIDVELPQGSGDPTGSPAGDALDVPSIDGLAERANRVEEFDPASHRRALGADFAPGVHDLGGRFLPKEMQIAERLADEGWRVDARRELHDIHQRKNPDAMIRKSADDLGAVVEFKTPDSPKSNAVRRNMLDASSQVAGDGEVVIDGRPIGLSEQEASRAFRRACGQPGKSVARVVHVILGDGRLVTFVKEL